MGDANEVSAADDRASDRLAPPTDALRRATRLYTSQPPDAGFTYRAFTRQSMANIEQRKGSRLKQRASVAFLGGDKPSDKPDPYLASGQQLPRAFVRHLPSELIGRPIEDIDPFYRDQETFVIISRGKELTRFSAGKALCLFGPFHPVRRAALCILVHPLFSLLVILTILTNCALMTHQGSDVEKTEIIFTIVYTTEMGLKVLARGFIMDKFTYLRDPWNWLDFTVIIMAYLTIGVKDLGNLSVMRTFRVLRALKTVAIIPGMKTIVGAVIDSVKNLKDVVVLTLFSLSVFSLIGLQIYMGILTQKCIKDGPHNMTDDEWFTWNSKKSNWLEEPYEEIYEAYRLCGNATGAQSCPENYSCLQGFGPNPDYGFTNFDTFGWSLICSFRLMTQDFWEGLYMQVLKTAGSWHIIFFIISIFLGSIYLMNLILAIVAMSYNELQRRAEEEEEAEAEDEAQFLSQCKMIQEELMSLDHLPPNDEGSAGNGSNYTGAHSSYRPSIEIGLLGQSVLAQLCQNGLLGQQVRQRLNEQFLGGVLAPEPGARSHSFSVQQSGRPGGGDDNVEWRSRCGSIMGRHQRNQPHLLHHQLQDDLPISSAKSLVELRRKSSARGSPIRLQRQHLLTPTPSAPPSPPSHLIRQQQQQQVSSSSQVLSSDYNSNQSHKMTIQGKQSSSSSYRDLSVLRKRAATIRIVSDDYDFDQPPATTTTITAGKGYKLVKDQLESRTTIKSEPGASLNLSAENTATNSPYVVEAGAFGWRTRRCSELERKSFRQNNYKSTNKHLLNVAPEPQQFEQNGAKCYQTTTRARSQDYSAMSQQDDGSRRNEAMMMNRFRSETAICEQPRPITSVFTASNSEGHLAPPVNNEAPVVASPQQMKRQTLTTNLLVPAGELQQEASSNNLHRLSVENFQQFVAINNGDRLQVQPGEHRSSFHMTNNQQQFRRISRLDSRGHINPQLMASMALWPDRTSMMVTSSGADNYNNGQLASRRPSRDFVRRASNWSRMSMSTNLDLRRLLRLWAHTNPYQARRQSGTGSYFSQSSRMGRAYQQSNYQQQQSQSPANLSRLTSRQNSPRPSSVGSTRQAYELMSAFSRNHDLYYGHEGTRPQAINPMEDQFDQLSIGWRDKCLAYSLSCLDLLCIWECCDAWLAVQRFISVIVFDPFTELFIILCILINTLFMALDSDDADANMKSIFERGNYFFTATFAVEASMKIMALSPKFYFREGWNVFDSIIVGLSLLELGLEGVYGLSVLRSFRLLRVFKLAKSWPTLNLLISIMGKAVGDLGNLTFVLAIIVFIFAVMGMQLFGSKYKVENFNSGQLPRWNFTDFMHSFMIVFRILCAEWIEPMWDCLLVGGWPCIPFFLIAVTVGNLVVLNLFLALLLASFGASNLSSPQADNVDTKKLREAIDRFKRFGRWLRRSSSRFLYQLAVCLHFKRPTDGINDTELDGDQDSNCGRDHKRAKGSHIVAMSRCERQKNIELRTEELKSRIRKSPEQHHHLKQLAQQTQQVRESRSGGNSGNGYNFNYSQHHSHQHHQHYNYHHYHHHYNYQLQHTDDDQKAPVIPIIVNEAPEEEQEEEEEDGCGGEEGSVSLHLESSSPTCTSPLDETTSIIFNPSSKRGFSANMQPIQEDSHDSDSNSNSLIVTEIGPKIVIEGYRSSSLDKLAQDEMLHLMLKQPPSNVDTEEDSFEKQQDLLQPTNDGEEEEEQEGAKSSLYLKAPKRENMEEEDERALQDIDYYLERCICIGVVCLKWFLFRQFVRKIVEHRYFDQCILVLIVISSGTLALEDKHLNERPNLKWTLDILDTIFTIIFSLEMISKWLAFGIKRYFGNIWSWLDFIIVLVSFINLMASIFGSGKIQALKTMRTLRAMRGLRPLRALQRFQGMRVVVNALIQAIPSIFNVLLVCLIFWLIFSIMGVQMFGGKFWRCLDPVSHELVDYRVAQNKTECIKNNLTWSNPQINFDNVLNAYLALFQVATFKGWIDIMNSASDSRNRDEQPIREANIYMYFYFVFFVIFGSFFTLNLFIGVIIDNFNEQKKKTGGSLEIFMTDDQKKYYHAMKKMRSKRPIKAMTRPKLKLQAYVFDLVTSKKFDMAIMLIIGFNMFIMSLEHYGQSAEYTEVLELLNLVFIAVFTLECLCKIFAMRHFYFREPWNLFDFVVVVLSLLGVLMKEYVAKYFVSPTLLRVVRVVKVGRVLRLVKGAKGIRTLLFALAMSLPALFNICLLLFLVMFIYAIFGMSFFMNVRPRAGIDDTFNFGTFSSSIIVLFQMSTSAGWDLVLDPLMDEENDCQKPDPALGIEGTCGNKTIAIIYLISYVIVTFLIIINMYIAVILENYSQATEDVQEGLTDDDYEMYYEVWQKFDPDGTQYIPYGKLSDFVDALEDPLRIPKPNDLALVVMDINIYQGDRCYCVDILDALTKFFFTRKGLVIQVNEHLQKVQSSLHETAFERITTTYLMKRENYCARVIQNCWRKWKQQTQQSRLKQPSTVIDE